MESKQETSIGKPLFKNYSKKAHYIPARDPVSKLELIDAYRVLGLWIGALDEMAQSLAEAQRDSISFEQQELFNRGLDRLCVTTGAGAGNTKNNGLFVPPIKPSLVYLSRYLKKEIEKLQQYIETYNKTR